MGDGGGDGSNGLVSASVQRGATAIRTVPVAGLSSDSHFDQKARPAEPGTVRLAHTPHVMMRKKQGQRNRPHIGSVLSHTTTF